MTPCYLIDVATVKQHVRQLYDTIDAVMLDPGLKWAHEYDIQPLLGDCYDGICTRKQAGNLTQADQDLLDAGEEFFAWAVFYRYIESGPNVHFMRAGLVRHQDEETVSASSKDVDRQSLTAARNMSHLRQEFEQWLDDNRSNYPCLPDKSCKDDNLNFMIF